jgi:ParB family chromosome partitioning protein
MLAEGKISSGHARALLGLESAAAQLQMANSIVKQGWSVRQVEKLVAAAGTREKKEPGEPEAPKVDPNLRAAVLEMERTLGTRVKIHGDEKRGKIEVSYFSAEDLNRLYEWIVRR